MVTAANPYRDQRTQYDPGMGMDELCDALNLGLYIGVTAPSGSAPTISSAIISFLQSGTATSRTLQEKVREVVHLTDYMSAAQKTDFYANTAAVDCADAFSKAIAALTVGTNEGGTLYVPSGTALIASQISVADNSWVDIVGGGYSSVIQKGFNGDMISLGAGCNIRNVRLQGAGATYTGRGVLINTGGQAQGFARQILDSWILDTASYCVEFSGASSGYASLIHGCKLIPTGGSTHAIKFPGVAETLGGNRTISCCFSASNPLVDLDNVENATIIGCIGGVPTFSANTLKVSIVGGRYVSTSGWTLDGDYNAVVGAVVTSNTITFASTLTAFKWKGNVISAGTTITDNAKGASEGNDIDIDYKSFTPTWTSTGTAPAIGNGTLTGSVQRRGGSASVQITWTAGSTTTFGTGSYSFSIPYAASRLVSGSGLLHDSGTGFYVAGSHIDPSIGQVAKLFNANGSQADFIGATSPFTFANGDSIYINIDYPIN